MAYYSLLVLLLIIFLLLFTYFSLRDKLLIYPLLLPMYSALWQIVSVLVVEHGFYITEQKIYSYHTFGAIRTIFSHAIFFISFAAFSRIFPKLRVQDTGNRFGSFFAAFIFAWVAFGLIISYLNAISSPLPITDLNITRFNFMENSRYPWVSYITSERFFYAFSLIGATYSYYSKVSLKRRAIFLYLLLIIYLFLIGEKFTGPVLGSIILFIYIMVNFHQHHEAKHLIVKIKIFFIIFSALIFAYVYYNYIYRYTLKDVVGSPILALLYRAFVLQGHTQWGLDALYALGRGETINAWSSYAYSGMSIAMDAIAPPEVLDAFKNVKNASFSSAYPGILLYAGGWPVVFSVQICMAFVYLLIARCFLWSIANRYLLSSIFSMQAMFVLFYIYNMGNFNELLSIKFLASVFGILFVLIARSTLNVQQED